MPMADGLERWGSEHWTSPWVRTALIVGLLGIGLALRLPGLSTDFWLDEIWSWSLAQQVTTPDEIFTSLHADNNNYFNTLWLWLCGPAAPVWLYRLHSLVAGCVTVVVVVALTRRFAGRDLSNGQSGADIAGGVTGLLLATSAVYAIYSSEARGYALAILAAALSQWQLGDALRQPRASAWLVFSAISLGGFLGHLSYLTVFVAQAVWLLVELAWPRQSDGLWGRRACGGILAFLGPTLGVAWLYFIDLRVAQVGGGPDLDPLLVAVDTLAEPFGHLDGISKMVAAMGLLGLLCVGLLTARGGESHEWICCAALVVVAPGILFGLAPAGLVYPRHFLVPMVVLFPALGLGLTRLGLGSRAMRMVAVCLSVLWVAGNSVEFAGFFRDGRGQYAAALCDLVDETTRVDGPEAVAVVGSDHDFRNGMLVAFHSRRDARFRRIEYRPLSGWPAEGVDWLILHDLDPKATFPTSVTASAKLYRLVNSYGFSGPVGWHWGLYRRDELWK
jgi:hypothetical protein